MLPYNGSMSRVYQADAATRQAVTVTLSRELTLREDVVFAIAYGSFVTGPDGFRDIDVAVWLARGGDRFADVSLASDHSGRSVGASPVNGAFRNLLVHVYWSVDFSRVFDVLEHDLNDLRRFSEAVAALA